MRKSLAGVWTVAALVAACGGFGSEDEEEQQPPATPTDNAQPPPPPVDGKPVPGIYVSASKGRAGNSGFPGSPLPSLKEGLARAKAENLRLLVCAEEYAENVELIDGVSAYGYYDCSVEPQVAWVRITKRAIVRAPKSPAITARDLKLPTRLEGFEVLAPNLDGAFAKDREGSSIGLDARATAPNTLVVSDSVIRAGKAAGGVDGTPSAGANQTGAGKGNDGVEQTVLNCNPTFANCTNPPVRGPSGPSVTCDAEPAPGPGGAGGDGIWFESRVPQASPTTDHRGRPFVATAATALGGAALTAGTPGQIGTEGPDGANGAWKFDAEGIILGGGTAGSPGGPGQGGGGGGGSTGWYFGGGMYGSPPVVSNPQYNKSSTGGSGGAGGCGGLPGTPGGGGAASIGAFLSNAAVKFERSVVASSNGGRAGLGQLGSLGRSGGAGGVPGSGAAAGGEGGRGGTAGWSGHGAPGPSFAIAYFGIKATLEQTSLEPGSGGEGRPAVPDPLSVQPKTIPAVPIGQSAPEFEIKP